MFVCRLFYVFFTNAIKYVAKIVAIVATRRCKFYARARHHAPLSSHATDESFALVIELNLIFWCYVCVQAILCIFHKRYQVRCQNRCCCGLKY